MFGVKRGLEIHIDYYLRRRTPTIVYAMGRVGSNSLYRSLYAHRELVLFAHVLEPKNMKIRYGKRGGIAKWAAKHIIQKRNKAKIISLVRNPVECMVSAFAPNVKAERDAENGYQHLSSEELSDQFRSGYFDQNRHLEKLNWFDSEFGAALGIDVYKYPFDKESGFVQFQRGPWDVLILNTDMSDDRKAQLVSDFLGLTNLKIIHTRVGEAGAYGELYKVFKKRVTVPKSYLHSIINSRYAQHFFTQKTLDTMQQRSSASSYRNAINARTF